MTKSIKDIRNRYTDTYRNTLHTRFRLTRLNTTVEYNIMITMNFFLLDNTSKYRHTQLIINAGISGK